jgi:hypothetical protein
MATVYVILSLLFPPRWPIQLPLPPPSAGECSSSVNRNQSILQLVGLLSLYSSVLLLMPGLQYSVL